MSYHNEYHNLWMTPQSSSDDPYVAGVTMAYWQPHEGAVGGLVDEIEAYLFLDISEWEGKDCVDWANGVCRQLNIDSNIVNLWAFTDMTGTQLLSFTYEDFCNQVGTVYGLSFYREFMRLKESREAESAQQSLENPGPSNPPLEHPGRYEDEDRRERQPYLEPIIGQSRRRPRGPRVWEFLVRLLVDPQANPSLIKWEDEASGTFRLVQKERIAEMWIQRSREGGLSYNNLARTMRYHYANGALEPVMERQLVYRLGPQAKEYMERLKNQRL
ncbi:ETS-related transcription factor Elf-5-like isoform X1 [Penaeus monodon]|uniref:ETS-related transcription factor Elf-5-like isoform X1 n=2 Tax=Penaeus monodon TaxID=6687 RepID=UPI0018A78F47|nr:ETS-related transcription factor Elf-5-like isoform X1 [Penaeus monodon]XP_037790762.1 ETS-related transcription factor Elf-5-like isoform X1 [Penaeus monodon]